MRKLYSVWSISSPTGSREEPVALEVRKRIRGMFEHGKAHAGAVLEPAKDDEEQIVDLAGCSKVADKEVDLPCALLDVKVAEVEASEVGAEKDQFAQEIATEVHFGEDDGDHWFLDCFKVGEAEVAHGKRVADAS